MIEHLPGGTVVGSLSGEIDLASAMQTDEELATAFAEAHCAVIDMSMLEYLDSAGAALLHRLARRLQEEGTVLHLVAPALSPAWRVIKLVQLDRVTPLFETQREAVDALPRGV